MGSYRYDLSGLAAIVIWVVVATGTALAARGESSAAFDGALAPRLTTLALGHVLPVFSLVTSAIFQEIAAAVTEDLVKAGETTTLDLVLTPETNRLAT